MIPRAIQQIFSVTRELKAKGWDYKLEGQFLEIVSGSPSARFILLIVRESTTRPSTICLETESLTKRNMMSNMTRAVERQLQMSLLVSFFYDP